MMSDCQPLAPNQLQTSEELQKTERFFLDWVKIAFPHLNCKAYFLPPIYFKNVPKTTQTINGQPVYVLQPAGEPNLPHQSSPTTPSTGASAAYPLSSESHTSCQQSDTRSEAAMERVFCCLKIMSDKCKEIFFAVTNLSFGNYLGEPCYAAAVAQFPRSSDLPMPVRKGDFDFLLIHPQYGLVICEVKAIGDNLKQQNTSDQETDNRIRGRIKKAMSQLDKGEEVLAHLVSDIAPDLRITKTIAFPNLTIQQVDRAMSGDQTLTEGLLRCLGAQDPGRVVDLCLCADHLSDPCSPMDVSDDVLSKLRDWWRGRVAVSEPDSHMTPEVYERLVARFCGPATTVTVPCISLPRFSVRTQCQAVSRTGDCLTAHITLFPEQVEVVHEAYPRVFLSGPPGTGKTTVLQLVATKWLCSGHDVHLVVSWKKSRAASSMMHHLLQKVTETGKTTVGKVNLFDCDLSTENDVERAVDDLSKSATGRTMYVIADEAGPDNWEQDHFETFCARLREKHPDLHLWAASCYRGTKLSDWKEVCFTKPLRSPPVVVRQVSKAPEITTDKSVEPYSERDVPSPTDGPAIEWIHHEGQGHSQRLCDCKTCGRKVANFIRYTLRIGAQGQNTTAPTASQSARTPPELDYKDVLVLFAGDVSENFGVLEELKESQIPVRVMKDSDVDDVATATTDVVWVANGDDVRSLERKVVVFLQGEGEEEEKENEEEKEEEEQPVSSGQRNRRREGRPASMDECAPSAELHIMSRCTSQLVVVSRQTPDK